MKESRINPTQIELFISYKIQRDQSKPNIYT